MRREMDCRPNGKRIGSGHASAFYFKPQRKTPGPLDVDEFGRGCCNDLCSQPRLIAARRIHRGAAGLTGMLPPIPAGCTTMPTSSRRSQTSSTIPNLSLARRAERG